MDGKILGIDQTQNKAIISSSTGERVSFNLDEWKSPITLANGMNVDYELDSSSNQAVNVFQSLAEHEKSTKIADAKAHKSKASLLVQSIIAGGIGIHKFYVGSWGWGLLYIVFCWTYIPTIISVIEAIRYITLTEQEINDRVQRLNGPFSFLW